MVRLPFSGGVGCHVAGLALCAAVLISAGNASAAGLVPLNGPGVTFSAGRDVSGDGSTVVGFYSTATEMGAYRWTAATGMVSIGAGSNGTTAWATSTDGRVVVGAGLPTVADSFRWTSATGAVALGTLGGGFNDARNVTGDGAVVVGRSGSQAYRWTSAAGMVGLGELPGGSASSDAFDVSNDGSVVVGRSNSADGQEAFRWASGTGMAGLGDLPGGTFHSQALGITADGSVIVGTGTSADGREAIRYTAGGGMVGIGDLPGGAVLAEANAVSDDGLTITGFGTTAAGSEAFVWTPTGGMQRLWDVLLAAGVDPAADGWTRLSVGNGISADGTRIAGQGTRNGNTEAFLATIPEPSGVALLAPALLALARRPRE